MARSRLQKTLADYAVIAITPALIMVLVTSLVFFLLEVTYSGPHELRFRWILFWFVFASVLIARIAIEQGSAYASVFGFALAAATGLVVLRYVDVVFTAFCLLGVIWWCSHKLTQDSTLIDDSEDASGEGLLQAAGIDQSEEAGTDSSESPPDRSWRQRLLGRSKEREKKPHAPGLWVVYFSLAALPLFGFGQLMIPANDPAARQSSFRMLWLYVAAALGLLLTTSFLGLRRYLRQRKLQMPAKMTSTWLAMGAALALAVLLICMVLPRPHNDRSLAYWVDQIAEKAREASEHAFLQDDAGEGEGERAGRDENANKAKGDQAGERDDGKKEGENGTGGEGDESGDGKKRTDKNEDASSRESSDEGAERSDSRTAESSGSEEGRSQDDANRERQGEKRAGRGKSSGGGGRKGSDSADEGGSGQDDKKVADQRADAKQADQAQQAKAGQEDPDNEEQEEDQTSDADTPASGLSALGGFIEKLIKCIFYGLMAVVVVVILIYNWQRILAALSRLLNELLALFQWRRREPDEEPEDEDESSVAPPRPFADFANPFTTGTARKRPPAELVRYTFEALQAWAEEQGLGRRKDQTPLEFAQSLGRRAKAISPEANQLAQLYARLAYGGQTPKADCLDVLERLWRGMTAPMSLAAREVEAAG